MQNLKTFNIEKLLKPYKEEEISFILSELSNLLSSKINILYAIDVLSNSVSNEFLKQKLLELKEFLQNGFSLRESFKRVGIFPEFLPLMLDAAETEENLQKIFESSSRFVESSLSYKSKIISNAVYPFIVISFSILAVFISTSYVVPKIRDILKSFGKDLPLITIIMIYISKALLYLFLLLPIIFILFLFKERFIDKEKIDRLYLKIPLIGELIYYYEISRFSYTLGLTLSTNVSILSAIKVSVNSLTNSFLKKKLSSIEKNLSSGFSLVSSFRETNVFKEDFLSLLYVGESSDELGRSLFSISKLYERKIENVLNTISKLIEPISIVIIGFVIALIVFSVMLPIVDISSFAH